MKLNTNKLVINSYFKFLRLLNKISPTINTKFYYFISHKKRLNLKEPKLFNEKMLYLKLKNANNPLIIQCVDKYRVRDYVESKGLPHILNDLISVYDSIADIDWKSLPNSFAMKLNTGSGNNLICRNKDDLDIEASKLKLAKFLANDDYLIYSELQYANVRKKIIVEKYLDQLDCEAPQDYKFYCFRGKVKYLQVNKWYKNHQVKSSIYNLDNLKQYGSFNHYIERAFEEPENFLEMIDIASKLSQDFPFVRVDLYNINHQVIFGELTFTPCGGTIDFPSELDKEMGDLIEL